MKSRLHGIALAGLMLAVLSGCASYRTSSNVEAPAAAPSSPAAPAAPAASPATIQLVEGGMANRKYRELGPIEVSIKKLTIFHKDPTKEQANEALIERARVLGADAVINVTYKTGIGFTTWGYIDATGTAIKFTP